MQASEMRRYLVHRKMGKMATRYPSPYTKLGRDKWQSEAPKGYMPVLVGEEEAMEKIMVPTKLFKHPYMVDLLDISAVEFGYEQAGTLKIHFNAASFKMMVEKLSKKR